MNNIASDAPASKSFTFTEAQIEEIRASATLLVGGLEVDRLTTSTLEAVERLDQAARALESFASGDDVPTPEHVRELVEGLRGSSSRVLEGSRRMRHVLSRQIKAVEAERAEVLASARAPEVRDLMASNLEKTLRELRSKL